MSGLIPSHCLISSGAVTNTVQFANDTSPFNSFITHFIRSTYFVSLESIWNRFSNLSILSRSSWLWTLVAATDIAMLTPAGFVKLDRMLEPDSGRFKLLLSGDYSLLRADSWYFLWFFLLGDWLFWVRPWSVFLYLFRVAYKLMLSRLSFASSIWAVFCSFLHSLSSVCADSTSRLMSVKKRSW